MVALGDSTTAGTPAFRFKPDVVVVLARMRQVNAWIKVLSTGCGLTFCDTFAAVENPDRPRTWISSPDGLPPSAEGYRKMADAIAIAIMSPKEQTDAR